MRIALSVFVLFVFFSVSCESNKTPPSQTSLQKKDQQVGGKSLTIGSISVSYKYEEKIFRPIIQYLVDRLNKFGYTDAKSVIVSSMEELIERANNNNVDIFFGSLYPTVTIDLKSKLDPVLKGHHHGTDHYYSIFFTKLPSAIKSIEDIKGRMVAFENRHSTSGYYYPLTLFKKMGYKLLEYDNPKEEVDPELLGYSFSSADGNTVAWVLNGFVDLGVTDNDYFRDFTANRPNELKIIHKSKKLLRFIISIRNDIQSEAKDKLIELLLKMPNDDEGKQIIEGLLDINKIEILDPKYYSDIKNDFEKHLFN